MRIEVSEASQAGEARRKAVALAEELQLDETRCGAVALAATEMATNLVKHAGSGYMLVQRLRQSEGWGMRLMSVDKGPGIADLNSALADGHSTAGSMGTGLGAIRRLADSFDIYSMSGSGTVINAEFRKGKHKQPAGSFLVAVVSEPIQGEEMCGDGWGARPFADAELLMVVDGLGHGLFAAEAAREAERVLLEARTDSLHDLFHDTHAALRKTRGAAFAVTKIEPEKGLVSFAGVGNVTGLIVSKGFSRGMASHNGTMGQKMDHLQEFTYPWNPNHIVIMHSDGLATRWDLERYPGIWNKAPAVIAALLHRDFCRGRDDVTVLVAKAA